MKYILIPKNNKPRSDYSRMFVFRDVAELAEYLESTPYAVKKAFQDGDEINGYFIDTVDDRRCWREE